LTQTNQAKMPIAQFQNRRTARNEPEELVLTHPLETFEMEKVWSGCSYAKAQRSQCKIRINTKCKWIKIEL